MKETSDGGVYGTRQRQLDADQGSAPVGSRPDVELPAHGVDPFGAGGGADVPGARRQRGLGEIDAAPVVGDRELDGPAPAVQGDPELRRLGVLLAVGDQLSADREQLVVRA